MNFEKYLHIPFKSQGRDHSGCDCWGLLWLIYKEMLGIELTTYAETPATSLRDIARLIAQHKQVWPLAVGAPKRFDAVVMKARNMENGHVGIAIDGRQFLHTESQTGPRLQRFDDPFAKARIVDIRRHECCL